MTFPVVTEDTIAGMWQNFLWKCALGTVVEAQDTTVWQKRDPRTWVRMGSQGDYSPESIAWPVQVLRGGVE